MLGAINELKLEKEELQFKVEMLENDNSQIEAEMRKHKADVSLFKS